MTMLAPAPGRVVLPWNTQADTPYVPSLRQREFHRAPQRYKLYGGAVGGGKTTALAVESLLLSWETPHNEGIVGRRDFDDLRRTTYAEVLKWCPPELVRQHHKSEHWLELINGSVIHFMELKDAGGLKNMNLGWFAIDQAEEVPYESFMWLQSRLRRSGIGRYYGLLSANPEPGWVKRDFVDSHNREYVFVPALPEDNPYLPDDYVSSLLERWPESYVRKLLLGNWDVVENAIYPQLDRTRHLVPMPDGLRFEDGAIGVDVGDVHPSAVVCVQRDSLGRYWVRECWAEVGGDYDRLFSAIDSMRRKYGVPMSRVNVDPMLKGWEKLIGVRRADASPGSRMTRIGYVTRLLNAGAPRTRPEHAMRGRVPSPYDVQPEITGGLLFDRNGAGVSDLFDEAVTYHYERRETDYVETLVPVRKADDRVAALEYAVEIAEQVYVPVPAKATAPVSLPRQRQLATRSI